MMRPAIGITAGIVIVMLTCAQHGSCCYPLEDVFHNHRKWMQIISMTSRRNLEFIEEADDIMTIDTDGNNEEMLRCLMKFGEHRYLVMIDDDDDGARYMCYQFTPLTDHVIRQGRTEKSTSIKKVNCIDDDYTEDKEVLIAYEDIQPQHCPLVGGYQLVIQQGMAVTRSCLNSVRTYNPHIQFHCDGRLSGNVVVDFGSACEPAALTPYMGGHHLAHLKCVSQWEENGFLSLLLQMRDHPLVFWCAHYKIMSFGGASGTNTHREELLEVFLTLDGRCSSQAFGDEDVPRNTSMFGLLVSYIPDTDIKCTNSVYIDNCQRHGDKCLETVECPSRCGRCQRSSTNHNCSFPADILGSWRVINSPRHLEMTVEKTKIKSPTLGDYLCVGAPDPDLQDATYLVVQVSTTTTCMSYYSCAEIYSPSPGILTFQLRPSFRSPDTGDPLTCKQSHDLLKDFTPSVSEEVITLMNDNKLHRSPCNHHLRSTYPTKLPGCKVVVHECSGTCQTLNVTFDIPSCGNDTERVYDIENSHFCYATIDFKNGVHGILARMVTSGRYLCWLFGNDTKLYVARPEDCNQDSVNQIFTDATAHLTYDPVSAISLTLPSDNSAAAVVVHASSVLVGFVVVYVPRAHFISFT